MGLPIPLFGAMSVVLVVAALSILDFTLIAGILIYEKRCTSRK